MLGGREKDDSESLPWNYPDLNCVKWPVANAIYVGTLSFRFKEGGKHTDMVTGKNFLYEQDFASVLQR